MRRLALIAIVFTAAGCLRYEPPRRTGPLYIDVVMRERDVPQLKLRGGAMARSIRVSYDEPGSSDFEFHLLAMDLTEGQSFFFGGENGDPEHHAITFNGVISRTADDGFTLEGTLVNRPVVVIRYVEAVQTGLPETGGDPEQAFEPGTHRVRFHGTIRGRHREANAE